MASEWGALDTPLFGSGCPAALPQEPTDGPRAAYTILERTALPRVPEEQIDAIIHRDRLALLGLA